MATILQLQAAKRRVFEKVSLERCLVTLYHRMNELKPRNAWKNFSLMTSTVSLSDLYLTGYLLVLNFPLRIGQLVQNFAVLCHQKRLFSGKFLFKRLAIQWQLIANSKCYQQFEQPGQNVVVTALQAATFLETKILAKVGWWRPLYS